jgi:transcriptional regulator with XRE-family HTH domain
VSYTIVHTGFVSAYSLMVLYALFAAPFWRWSSAAIMTKYEVLGGPLTKKPCPELADRIVQLRKLLKLSQSEFGQRLNASAMAVSRWERGLQAPSADVCVLLGRLAGRSGCWYFWGKAGLSSDDVLQVLPRAGKHQRKSSPPVLGFRANGNGKASLIAIPLLPLAAAADKEGGSPHFDFNLVEPENMLAAPSRWCPNPSLTSALRVSGDSMEPLLYDGYIIVVDRAQKDRGELKNKVVIAFHDQYGLVVSRVQRVGNVDMLVPDNRVHEPVSLTHDWRIVGKVLWWIGMPA